MSLCAERSAPFGQSMGWTFSWSRAQLLSGRPDIWLQRFWTGLPVAAKTWSCWIPPSITCRSCWSSILNPTWRTITRVGNGRAFWPVVLAWLETFLVSIVSTIPWRWVTGWCFSTPALTRWSRHILSMAVNLPSIYSMDKLGRIRLIKQFTYEDYAARWETNVRRPV